MTTELVRDEMLKDVEDHFSAENMLSCWSKISAELKNKRVRKYGQALNKWLNIDEDSLEKINLYISTLDFQFIWATDILWKSERNKHLLSNDPEYNLSEDLNEWYYSSKRLYLIDIHSDEKMIDALTETRQYTDLWEGTTAIWNVNRQPPTIKDYLMLLKECSLYRGHHTLMKVYSQSTEDYSRVIKCIALLSNLYNDHKLLLEELHADDNVRIGDISNRVFTFPLVYALNNEKTGNALKNLIRLEKQENGIKEYILTKLEDCGALSYSENNINRLREETLKEIDRHGGNDLLVEWINENFSL